MIDARARVLQLKGVRAGNIVAVHAVRGINAVVDVAALWSIGTTVLVKTTAQDPLLVDESVIRARAVGVMASDGGYRPTGIVNPAGQPREGSASLIFSGREKAVGVSIRSRTAGYLKDSMLQAQTVFGLSERTVLGSAPPGDEGSLLETWYVLANGGTVDLISESAANCPRLWREHLRESKFDFIRADVETTYRLQSPPEEPALMLPQVRDVILSGAEKRPGAITLISDTFPNANLHPDTFDGPGPGR
jgi:hypothetical protein